MTLYQKGTSIKYPDLCTICGKKNPNSHVGVYNHDGYNPLKGIGQLLMILRLWEKIPIPSCFSCKIKYYLIWYLFMGMSILCLIYFTVIFSNTTFILGVLSHYPEIIVILVLYTFAIILFRKLSPKISIAVSDHIVVKIRDERYHASYCEINQTTNDFKNVIPKRGFGEKLRASIITFLFIVLFILLFIYLRSN